MGKTLDCNAIGANGALTYEWLSNGGTIDGADGASYPLVDDDLGARISCRITAANPARLRDRRIASDRARCRS